MAKTKQASGPVESILGVSASRAGELLGVLTERERQVADLMASGTKNRKIAKELGISPKTLDIHRANLKRKLKCQTSVDVARVVIADLLGKHLS